jgi:hypothetical protein
MKLVGWSVAICVVLSIGCARSTDVSSKEPNREPDGQPTPARTKPPIPIEITSLSSTQLCNRLAAIETIPTFDPTITDPIYECLIAKGDDAIPCLVEKISDKTLTSDPRYSVPHWQYYAVGDTAVFILIDILRRDDVEREKLLIEMLPPRYKNEWKTNGIYAYFNYVSEPKNRKELRRWWENWIRNNK